MGGDSSLFQKGLFESMMGWEGVSCMREIQADGFGKGGCVGTIFLWQLPLNISGLEAVVGGSRYETVPLGVTY